MTELERVMRDRGAALEAFQGVMLPSHFGDVDREWRAAREGAAVFAAGFRSAVAATGEDRVSFLQGMLSNDVKTLAPGQGIEAALLDQQGKIVTDLRVYADADRLILDVLAWRRQALCEALSRFIVADDVELDTAGAEVPLVAVEGPLARAVVMEALGVEALPRAPYSHAQFTFESAPLRLVAASEGAGDGVLVFGPERAGPPLFDACVEAGGMAAGMRALNVLRIEAGVPWAGIDMDETVLIMETNRQSALSFSKGCYLGQEVVERIAARGHVNRHLRGLVIEGSALPESGASVRVADRTVGSVTSAVYSPLLQRPIALALVHRAHASPGDRVEIDSGGAHLQATVSDLPFTAGDA